MHKYKKQALDLYEEHSDEILPAIIYLGLLSILPFLFQDLGVIVMLITLCCSYGYVSIGRKVVQSRYDEIGVVEDSLSGFSHFKDLWFTYIIYRAFKIGIMILETVIIGYISAIFYRKPMGTLLNMITSQNFDNIDLLVECVTKLIIPIVILGIVFVLTEIIYELKYEAIEYVVSKDCKGFNALEKASKISKHHRLQLFELKLSYLPLALMIIIVSLLAISGLNFVLSGMWIEVCTIIMIVFDTILISILVTSKLTIAKYLFYRHLDESIDENEFETKEEVMEEEKLDFEPISKTKLWLGVGLFVPFYLEFGSYIISLLFLMIPFFARITDETILNSYFNLFYDGCLLFIALILFKDLFKDFFHRFYLAIKDHPIAFTLKGYALIYVSLIISSTIVELILHTSEESANQAAIEEILKVAPVPMIISVVLFAPILEEIVFRGLIFRAFRNINVYLGHFVSAFAFGFVHCMSAILVNHQYSEIVQILPYFCMGLVLSYYYDKHKTIGASIYLHMLNNLISVILIFL